MCCFPDTDTQNTPKTDTPKTDTPKTDRPTQPFDTPHRPKPSKRRRVEVIDLIQEIREEERAERESLKSTIVEIKDSFDKFLEATAQRNRERDEEEKKQFRMLEQMHKEKLEMQKALLAALQASNK